LDDPTELSDADLLKWAGADPGHWASLTREKREAWLDHLVARIGITSDDERRNALWRLAYVIVSADACELAPRDDQPNQAGDAAQTPQGSSRPAGIFRGSTPPVLLADRTER
jgi:hypothetical protein